MNYSSSPLKGGGEEYYSFPNYYGNINELFLPHFCKPLCLWGLKGQAFLGGTSALMAVGLFPLVGFVTGVPACKAAGTAIPLSLYYSYLAVFLSAFTVPLGFWLGARISEYKIGLESAPQRRKLGYLASPITVVLCLGIIALIRLI